MAGNSSRDQSAYGNSPTWTAGTEPDVQRLRKMHASLVYALDHCTGSERPLFLQIRRAAEMLDSRITVLSAPPPDPGARLAWETGPD